MLTSQQRKEIQDKAVRFMSSLESYSIPPDFIKIIKEMGGEVKYDKKLKYGKVRTDTTKKGFVINVWSKDFNDKIVRYELAREIGHIVLQDQN